MPTIYVASLSDYNAGTLHGAHIDAAQEPDAIYAEIKAMLDASPEFRAFPAGGPAEEWAIHDYEGFGPWRLSEYQSIETVSLVARAIEEFGDDDAAGIVGGYISAYSFDQFTDYYDDVDGFVDLVRSHYRGNWSSFKDYVTSFDYYFGPLEALRNYAQAATQYGTDAEKENANEAVDHLNGYIDWDLVAREAEMEGYTTVSADTGGIHIFEDEV